MFILRDPEPSPTAGGGTPAPTPTPTPPAPTPTPTPLPPPPTPSAKIEVTPEEFRQWQEDRSRLAEIEAEKRRAVEEKEAARLKALAEKGQADEALTQLRSTKDKEIHTEREGRLAAERELLEEGRTNIINASLLGVNYSDEHAAEQVRDILERRIESVRGADGKRIVRDKLTGKSAEVAIKEWLATPQAAKFLQATTAGGAGATGTHKPPPPVVPEDPFARQLKANLAANRTGAPGLAGTYNN